MHRNNMTGEPNQQNPPSVFGFNAFPTSNSVPSVSLNWPASQPAQPLVNQPIPDPFISAATSSFPITQSIPLQSPVPPTQFHQEFGKRSEASLAHFQFGTVYQQQIQSSNHGVVQFPFTATIPFDTNGQMPLRCKRKTDSPEFPASKKHITEEKMAEHMSKLHISSETQTSPTESDSTRTKRLYMCEEMRKLQTESILPQCLINRIQRPCTDLVLWTPPERILLRPFEQQQQNENNNNNNNNEVEENYFMENELEEAME